MKLSRAETKIYEALSVGPRTIEELAEVVYSGRERPKYWRSSVASAARMLCLKTQGWPRPAARTSPLGRARKGVYSLAS